MWRRPTVYDGRLAHEIAPWEDGPRVSVTWYSVPESWGVAPEVKRRLQAAGFRLPESAGDCDLAKFIKPGKEKATVAGVQAEESESQAEEASDIDSMYSSDWGTVTPDGSGHEAYEGTTRLSPATSSPSRAAISPTVVEERQEETNGGEEHAHDATRQKQVQFSATYSLYTYDIDADTGEPFVDRRQVVPAT